jgi:rhodanese-related sulfurtransferase
MEKKDTGNPICCAPGALTESAFDSERKANLPQAKQTVLGLYVSAKEAYEQWQAAPDQVLILDVRTLEEYLFVGSPPMAWRIPVAVQSYEWNEEKKTFLMAPLADFVSRVQSVANPGDTIMVMCRSGGRSAIACNMLAQAGFTQAYNMVDGMEGDGHGNSESEVRGGWKNTGCPWTKKITPDHMVLPSVAAR